MNLWPHQRDAVDLVCEAKATGVRRLCLQVPTGGGKTLIDATLLKFWREREERTVLYTNRRQLLAQLSRALNLQCVPHGIRAAGVREELDKHIQVSSIQTEIARVGKGDAFELHDAQNVIVDEAHQITGAEALQLLDSHREAGAFILGQTATPVGLKGVYDELLSVGTLKQLRACGALVPARHFGCDEPDLRKIRNHRFGVNLGEDKQRKIMMVKGVVGRIRDWYCQTNPERRPTILYAPGVKESVYFAEQLTAEGFKVAHVDGVNIWKGGKLAAGSVDERESVLDDLEAGRLDIVCNRFVLREGIDRPKVSHAILACVIGQLSTYLQICGRLLRASPGKDFCTIQDHGGAWWRHGSCNDERDWSLEWDDAVMAAMRAERMRAPKPDDPPEPGRCPRCGAIVRGPSCRCGWELPPETQFSRPVVQEDGSIIQYEGKIFRQRKLSEASAAEKDWTRCYYQAKNGGLTFRQAEANYARTHEWEYPPHTLPLMPRNEADWYRKVRDVPAHELTPVASPPLDSGDSKG